MHPSELARLEHENMLDVFARIGSGIPGALIERSNGVTLFVTGLPLRLFNQVAVHGDDATEGAIRDAVAAMRSSGAPFALNLRVGTDDRFIEVADRLGLLRLSVEPWMPGMALHPLTAGPAPGDPRSGDLPPADLEHEIRLVTDLAGIEDHVRVVAEGFDLPEPTVRAIVRPDLLGMPDVFVYVGYEGGVATTSGLGMRTGQTIGVYNIATVPAARRRGWGASMTARIAADGAAAGCVVAILQASSMGYPIYERMGFRTVVDYMAYVDPTSRTTS